MATKDRKLNNEELELVGLLLEQKAREVQRAKFHDWGARGKTTHTYCRPIRRKGDEKPLFRTEWVHRWIKSKNIAQAIYPDAKQWEYICLGPGENMCPICEGIARIKEYADRLEEKNRKKRADELRQLCQGSKAKQIRHWVGITYNDDGTINGIEPYRLLNWYFEKSLLGLLTEKKYTLAQWVKKNPELKKKKPAEREAHWLGNCPPKREFPDDAKNGWKFFVSKSGSGLDTTYTAKFEEVVPLSKGSDEVKALKEALSDGDYPDLDKMLKKMKEEEMTSSIGGLNKLLLPKGAMKKEEIEEEEDEDDGPEDELDEDDGADEDDDGDDEDDSDDDDGADDDDDDGDDDDEDEDGGDDDDDGDDDDEDEEPPEPPKKKKKKSSKKKAADDDEWEDIPF